MSWLSSLESAASSVAKAAVDSAKGIEHGGQKALSDVWSAAVDSAEAAARGEIDAAKVVTSGTAKAASDLTTGIAQGNPLGGLEKAGEDVEHAAAGGYADIWNAQMNSASKLLGGINHGVHDMGAAAQDAYVAGVGDVANAVGKIAGGSAANIFRAAAIAAERPIKVMAQFQWGIVEGVVEGLGGAVKGLGSLAADGYEFATDNRYRNSVIRAVESGGTYVAEHPLDAASKVGSTIEHLAVGVYQGGVKAAKKGDLAEYIGKGVGQVGFAVATTVVAPEADVGEGAALAAEVAGDGSKAVEMLDVSRGADAVDLSEGAPSVTEGTAEMRPADVRAPAKETIDPSASVKTDEAVRVDLRKQLEIKNAKALERGKPEPYTDVDAAVEERLDGWKKVNEQGFPNGFKDKAAFDSFKEKIVGELEKYGAPTDDIGVHGSAVSSLNPNDIDVGVRVDEARFDALVRKALEIKPGSQARIDGLAEKGILPSYFQGTVDGVTFPTAIYGAAGDMKIQVSFILKGGSFDVGPYLKF